MHGACNLALGQHNFFSLPPCFYVYGADADIISRFYQFSRYFPLFLNKFRGRVFVKLLNRFKGFLSVIRVKGRLPGGKQGFGKPLNSLRMFLDHAF